MKYTLIQFKATGKKGKYEPMVYTKYSNPITAFNEAMQMHQILSAPYAGFLIRDENGHTIHRVKK